MRRLPPQKDVAGIHFMNRGISTYPPYEVPETVQSPEILAVAAALKECRVEFKGGKVAVVGSGPTAGMTKLLAGYLYDKGCNVRLLRFENLGGARLHGPDLLRSLEETQVDKTVEIVNPDGEAVVSWTNQPGWLTKSRLKPGCVVIDMGYKFSRGKISGDADFMSISQVASAITPVPGGVRNIVKVMILQNLIQLINMQVGISQEAVSGALRRRFPIQSSERQGSLKRIPKH
jgi:5,10-methylene-tetrahydrofolate dehydrogenase/methenyl tetrahydrofolate cyclohydrolase